MNKSNLIRLSKCPCCGKQTTLNNNPSRPFCCERCKRIDLGHWASEQYRVASDVVNDEHLQAEMPTTPSSDTTLPG